MSLLKKLFGGGGSSVGVPANAEPVSYEGYSILPSPMEEGGQFRVCALIRKEVDGEMREHKLIRADICSSAQEASDMSLRKAQQMIDERGERVFD